MNKGGVFGNKNSSNTTEFTKKRPYAEPDDSLKDVRELFRQTETNQLIIDAATFDNQPLDQDDESVLELNQMKPRFDKVFTKPIGKTDLISILEKHLISLIQRYNLRTKEAALTNTEFNDGLSELYKLYTDTSKPLDEDTLKLKEIIFKAMEPCRLLMGGMVNQLKLKNILSLMKYDGSVRSLEQMIRDDMVISTDKNENLHLGDLFWMAAKEFILKKNTPPNAPIDKRIGGFNVDPAPQAAAFPEQEKDVYEVMLKLLDDTSSDASAFAPAWAFQAISESAYSKFMSETCLAALYSAKAMINTWKNCSEYTMKELIFSPAILHNFTSVVAYQFLSNTDRSDDSSNTKRPSTYTNVNVIQNTLQKKLYGVSIWFTECVYRTKSDILAEFERNPGVEPEARRRAMIARLLPQYELKVRPGPITNTNY
jgi:hypothetical protein